MKDSKPSSKPSVALLSLLMAAALSFVVFGFLSSEENAPARSPAPSKSPLYPLNRWSYGAYPGVYDGCIEYTEDVEAVLILRMKPLFEYERRRWLARGFPPPYLNPGVTINPETADKMWFDVWLLRQLALLADKGWKLTAVQGERYFFTSLNPGLRISSIPYQAFSFHKEELPDPLPRGPGGDFLLPLSGAGDPPDESKWHGIVYPSCQWMVLPFASSLRIYFPRAVNATYCFFYHRPYLRFPTVKKWNFYRIHWDAGRYNVIRVDFIRDNPAKMDFWDWALITLKTQLAIPPNKVGDRVGWAAWEFLDENGKPLPADLPFPVRWFPKNFDKIFKPIPLPEELKALPEAQD